MNSQIEWLLDGSDDCLGLLILFLYKICSTYIVNLRCQPIPQSRANPSSTPNRILSCLVMFKTTHFSRCFVSEAIGKQQIPEMFFLFGQSLCYFFLAAPPHACVSALQGPMHVAPAWSGSALNGNTRHLPTYSETLQRRGKDWLHLPKKWFSQDYHRSSVWLHYATLWSSLKETILVHQLRVPDLHSQQIQHVHHSSFSSQLGIT